MKIPAIILAVVVSLSVLFAVRIAVKSYLSERSDFVRHPPSELSQHPEQTEIPNLREISFGRFSETHLAGWYAPSSNGAAVILVHGTDSDRSSVIAEIRILAQGGFGVLALDLPGQGASGGESQWGEPERDAISSAIDWLSQQHEVDTQRIGAMGLSMGGYVLTQAAVLDQRLRAIVIAASPNDIVEQNWRASGRWGWLSQVPADWALRVSGMPLDMRPKDIAGKISPRPILVIAGELDELVPEYMAREIFASAHDPKELWIVPGAHHLGYADIAPDEYGRRLLEFFTRTLPMPQLVHP